MRPRQGRTPGLHGPISGSQEPGQAGPDPGKRIPFQDASARSDPPRPNNLKITNESSTVQTPSPTRKQHFDKAATEAHDRSEDYKKRAYELGTNFVRILDDRKLPENKGPTAKSVESQTLNELLMLGVEMNLDLTQEEGMGSIGLITLLVKGLVLHRDRANLLAYRLDKMEIRLKELEGEEQIQPAVPRQNRVPIRQPQNPEPPAQNEPIRASRDPSHNPFEG